VVFIILRLLIDSSGTNLILSVLEELVMELYSVLGRTSILPVVLF